MARQRHLAKAPITEALIDLRVRPRADLKAEQQLSFLPSALQAGYPSKEVQNVFEAELQIGAAEGKFRPRGSAIHGYFYRSATEREVVQFRPDGFTFSRLRPYTEWNSVRADARKLWHAYLEQAKPELVTRVAVRYINHIPLPLPITDFGHFLLAPPKLPEGAPEALSGFLTRVTGRFPHTGIFANITQSLQRALTQEESIVILLDIDVFKRATDFQPADDTVWNLLDRLREVKNDIFFGSITERTAELFE